jgi:predicted nucleic acid-binding protein
MEKRTQRTCECLIKRFKFDKDKIEKRKNDLLVYHNSEKDCIILAEAEQSNMNILLTRDDDFIKRLSIHANGVHITKPSDYFNGLNIKPAAKPKLRPHQSNPLSQKTWWQI